MIAVLFAAGVLHAAPVAQAPTPYAPDAIVARYGESLARLVEPRTFTVEYTLEQTGTRTLEQTHRIFRHGNDERDEIIAVNGTRATRPQVRIFRGRPYRYRVAALAPKPEAYDFEYLGSRKDGHHADYVFRLTPHESGSGYTVTELTVDGVTFLPAAIAFRIRQNHGSGTITFAKSGAFWVASGASASARVQGGTAEERLTFSHWRFPASLPPSTFAIARPLPPAPIKG